MPGLDRISELPECLIAQILLHLPTKDSVRTSVLSTRWKTLWLHVPGLNLNCRDTYNGQALSGFIDRFLDFNSESRLQIFKVDYNNDETHGSRDWIATAVDRGIRLLDVESNSFNRDAEDGLVYPCIDLMPFNLFTSKTLVSLNLSFSGLQDPGFVSLPCLKSLHLRQVQWCTMTLEKLVSGSPLLEVLTYLRALDDNDLVVMRVRSPSLKSFSIRSSSDHGIFFNLGVAQSFEIDAPGLEYMSLEQEFHFHRILVKNLTSLSMVDLDIKFGHVFYPDNLSKRNEIRDFLTGISTVRRMIISPQTVKALYLYSKVELIPKFNYLSRLQAAFPSDLLQFLPAFLESFPNLKHLILKIVHSKKMMEESKLVHVPRCFVSTLECVEIKAMIDWEEDEMKIASYFLENSAVLKKLILSFMGCPQYHSDSDIYEDLNKLTKRSRRCRIIIANGS